MYGTPSLEDIKQQLQEEIDNLDRDLDGWEEPSRELQDKLRTWHHQYPGRMIYNQQQGIIVAAQAVGAWKYYMGFEYIKDSEDYLTYPDGSVLFKKSHKRVQDILDWIAGRMPQEETDEE